ncbi:hypothetical protein QBC43DRAFT_305146 [Cladorrhinum sp. PSN259]|nr:hypothetical protein QBC43DRAFT_305146 [Cladorrhinum sp. PSN259]
MSKEDYKAAFDFIELCLRSARKVTRETDPNTNSRSPSRQPLHPLSQSDSPAPSPPLEDRRRISSSTNPILPTKQRTSLPSSTAPTSAQIPSTTPASSRSRALSARPQSDKDGSSNDKGNPASSSLKRKRDNTSEPKSKLKRPKVQPPHSLDQLIRVLKGPNPLVIRQKSYRSQDIIRKIANELNKEFGATEEKVIASVYLLGQVFSDEGWDRFRSLYREDYNNFCHKDGAASIEAAAAVTADLRALSYMTLCQLVEIWAKLKKEDAISPRIRDIQHLKANLELIRQFLDEQNLRNKRSVTHQSQLTSFIAYRLGIPNKIFTLTVFRYKPIFILVKYFRDGILAFLPRNSILRCFTPLQIKSAGSPDNTRGKVIFCKVMERILVEVPVIKELCFLAIENAIQPILQGRSLPPTASFQLLEKGDFNKVEEICGAGEGDLSGSEEGAAAVDAGGEDF